MRILHVVHQYAPHRIGGTEVYTEMLAGELARRGHRVAVFTRVYADAATQPLTCEEDGHGVSVYRQWHREPADALSLFLDSYKNGVALQAFMEVYAQFRPEVVHIQHLKGLHHQLPEVAARGGARIVLTLHDYWYFCGNAQLIRPKGYTCSGPRLWLNCTDCAAHRMRSPGLLVGAPLVAALFARRSHDLERVLRAADVLIAPSSTVVASYARLPRIAPKIRLMRHGIQTQCQALDVDSHQGPLRLLFAGGLSWQKGVHILLSAFRSLPRGTATLDICGDGAAYPDYVSQLKASARGLDVRFHGPVSQERLMSLMRACDVLTIPSLWPETMSLVALQARSVGLPILASDIGALRERVAEAQDGWLVPPGDVVAWAGGLRRLADDVRGVRSLRQPRPVTTLADHTTAIEHLYGNLLTTG